MKVRRTVRYLALAVGALLLAITGTAQVGQLAPTFTARTTDGRTVSIADYRGKVTLIQFWASWCTVCAVDLPQVKELYTRNQSRGFDVIGISMDEDAKALQSKLDEKQIPWPQVMDGRSFDGSVASQYKVQGTPTYVLLDRAGRVAARTGDIAKLTSAVTNAFSKPVSSSPMANRDVWQRPVYVMDELGVSPGSHVADIGAGDGYFTMHLAERVGVNGKVSAVDISSEVLDTIDGKSRQRGLSQVVTAADGVAGLEIACTCRPDLIVLDVMLPRLSGLDVCRQVRSKGAEMPIIMLTARGQEIDKVVGLEVGADDYVTKPFSIKELLARVRAHLRRASRQVADVDHYCFGDVEVWFGRHEITKRGAALEFSPREFEILKYFIQRRGEAIRRDQLLDAVWGYHNFPLTRTVDNHIAKLRQKIEDIPAEPKYVITLHRVGYKFLG